MNKYEIIENVLTTLIVICGVCMLITICYLAFGVDVWNQ